VGFFSDLFGSPKPKPGVIIRNVLGEEIDRVEGTRDLLFQDLRGRQWPHVDLSGMFLQGANLEGANLMGGKFLRTSFAKCNLRNVDMAYGNAESAKFREADMRGCSLYKCEVSGADFPEIIRDHATDIPHFAFTQYQPRNRWAR
jgi:uncharacterized protein YjbI with pentapeptide repeats